MKGAVYPLELSHITINMRQSKFGSLTDLEIQKCSNLLEPDCTFRSPAYSIAPSIL